LVGHLLKVRVEQEYVAVSRISATVFAQKKLSTPGVSLRSTNTTVGAPSHHYNRSNVVEPLLPIQLERTILNVEQPLLTVFITITIGRAGSR
jgi:hypothetical protein